MCTTSPYYHCPNLRRSEAITWDSPCRVIPFIDVQFQMNVKSCPGADTGAYSSVPASCGYSCVRAPLVVRVDDPFRALGYLVA